MPTPHLSRPAADGVDPVVLENGRALREWVEGEALAAAPSVKAASSPTYVFKCTLCGKTFYRKNYHATLNKHKHNRTGHQCYCMIGRYVRTKY